MMTALVAVSVFKVNRKDMKLVLLPVVTKLALLSEIYLTLAPLLLLALPLPHMYRDCGRLCCTLPAVPALLAIRKCFELTSFLCESGE